MGYLWRLYRDHSLSFTFGFFLTAMGTLLRLQAYILAMVCLAGAVVSAMTWCLTSPKMKEVEDAADRPIPLILSMLILALGVGAIWGIWNQREKDILSAPNGWLVPADDPSPDTRCPAPPGGVTIYFGTSVAWATKFPHTVIRYRGENEFVIDRDKNNRIAISVKVRDKNNNIVTSIEKNEFNITNRALPTHKPRPDESTLVAYDEEGDEALNVRYLNANAISISAILY